MIYHCIHWWTMAFYVDIYMNFCFINICLIPISTNFEFVVVFIHVSTCNFINIRWNPIFVDFFVELIHEIDFSLMGDFCNDKSIGCVFTYIYHWNCNFHLIHENWCIWILMKIHVLWILRLCMFHCMIHTLQVFLGWFLCLKYRYIYFTLKKKFHLNYFLIQFHLNILVRYHYLQNIVDFSIKFSNQSLNCYKVWSLGGQ